MSAALLGRVLGEPVQERSRSRSSVTASWHHWPCRRLPGQSSDPACIQGRSILVDWRVIHSQSCRTQRRRTAGRIAAPCTMSMMGAEKTLRRVLSGTADAAIRFDDLCQLLESLGFEKRMRGSPHLFRKSWVEERVNLQRAGTNAKPYQVKQVRSVILKAKLSSER